MTLRPCNLVGALWVCPLAFEPPPAPAVVLRLDLGLAFGTGTHPTTAMCLRWLDANDVQGTTVIDYGCGSGILGIAALLLGAQQGYATDIDSQAIQATSDNARINQVKDRLLCCSANEIKSTHADIIIANILAAPLVKLAGAPADLCLPGARIVLSGLLVEQVDEVWQAYAPWFESMDCATDEQWACLSAIRCNKHQD